MNLVFKNPVWPHYFADPFILRSGAEYFAYGTGEKSYRAPDGRIYAFQVLRSRDLASWELAGGALEIGTENSEQVFWAPEIAARGDGKFYLYYSSAPRERDELHRIRVACGGSPLGPFESLGTVLPPHEGFCIDAHPFRDPRDGQRYLFFAKDFFEERTGTGVAVVRLSADMQHCTGPIVEVVRANADWQIYQRNRTLYEREWEAWHTVEGPCVVFHEGLYFCFYSGGNWQSHTYGVSYAVAESPLGPWTHAPMAGPIVLSQRAGVVLGPGHNSYIVGPDGKTELLVYHAWDAAQTARRMWIDRLIWTAEGPRCAGQTVTAWPCPL